MQKEGNFLTGRASIKDVRLGQTKRKRKKTRRRKGVCHCWVKWFAVSWLNLIKIFRLRVIIFSLLSFPSTVLRDLKALESKVRGEKFFMFSQAERRMKRSFQRIKSGCTRRRWTIGKFIFPQRSPQHTNNGKREKTSSQHLSSWWWCWKMSTSILCPLHLPFFISLAAP